MTTRLRALAYYIRDHHAFPCGDIVLPDGSNTQFSKERDRQGNLRWRLRCLDCNRNNAAVAMAKVRRERRRA